MKQINNYRRAPYNGGALFHSLKRKRLQIMVDRNYVNAYNVVRHSSHAKDNYLEVEGKDDEPGAF